MYTLSLTSRRPSLKKIVQRDHSMHLRSTRPSILDLRFTGDPWIVQSEDGTYEVVLGSMCLGRFHSEDIDLPSLLQVLERLRLPRHCRRGVS